MAGECRPQAPNPPKGFSPRGRTLPRMSIPQARDADRRVPVTAPNRLARAQGISNGKAVSRSVSTLVLGALVLGALWLHIRRGVLMERAGDVPYDLAVFFDAADAVIAGRSPFPPDAAAVVGDTNYVYPPLLSLALAPLAVIPETVAIVVWIAVLGTALAGALWLLGVRDWRVLPVMLLWLPTRDAVWAGTVGPLLALGMAVAWRYRDERPRLASVALGLDVALKVFTWPLVVWLAVTRRVGAALLATLVAAGAALAAWAVIGFDGILEYPSLLRRLSELEGDRSYSVAALGEALGLPDSRAVVVSVLGGLGLVVLGVRAARDARLPRSERDRIALTATIGAALALTPILWIHYLVLLAVPLALARPRLSLLWFLPVIPSASAIIGWQPAGWPEGDLASFAVVLVPALVVLLVTLRPLGPARKPPAAAEAAHGH